MIYRDERAALEARREQLLQQVAALRLRRDEQRAQIDEARAELVARLQPPEPLVLVVGAGKSERDEYDGPFSSELSIGTNGIVTWNNSVGHGHVGSNSIECTWLEVDGMRMVHAIRMFNVNGEVVGGKVLEVKHAGGWAASFIGPIEPHQLSAFTAWQQWFYRHQSLLATGRPESD